MDTRFPQDGRKGDDAVSRKSYQFKDKNFPDLHGLRSALGGKIKAETWDKNSRATYETLRCACPDCGAAGSKSEAPLKIKMSEHKTHWIDLICHACRGDTDMLLQAVCRRADLTLPKEWEPKQTKSGAKSGDDAPEKKPFPLPKRYGGKTGQFFVYFESGRNDRVSFITGIERQQGKKKTLAYHPDDPTALPVVPGKTQVHSKKEGRVELYRGRKGKPIPVEGDGEVWWVEGEATADAVNDALAKEKNFLAIATADGADGVHKHDTKFRELRGVSRFVAFGDNDEKGVGAVEKITAFAREHGRVPDIRIVKPPRTWKGREVEGKTDAKDLLGKGKQANGMEGWGMSGDELKAYVAENSITLEQAEREGYFPQTLEMTEAAAAERLLVRHAAALLMVVPEGVERKDQGSVYWHVCQPDESIWKRDDGEILRLIRETETEWSGKAKAKLSNSPDDKAEKKEIDRWMVRVKSGHVVKRIRDLAHSAFRELEARGAVPPDLRQCSEMTLTLKPTVSASPGSGYRKPKGAASWFSTRGKPTP